MFLPMREAATAKREKIKRVDAASDKRVAALYLETNKQYAMILWPTTQSESSLRQSLTSRSGVLMRRIADLAQTNCLVSILLGRKGKFGVDFLVGHGDLVSLRRFKQPPMLVILQWNCW